MHLLDHDYDYPHVESDTMKNEDKNSNENGSFSCKHCNKNFEEAKLLISHISAEHKSDSNGKSTAKKEKNQKIPCGECGKLYSDSGLRAHMIRVSFSWS